MVTFLAVAAVESRHAGFACASDGELLRAAARDSDAFAAFYDRYEGLILAYFLRRTRDAEVAADLTAEVFAIVLRVAGRYRDWHASAAPWLFAIARSTLVRSLRRGRVDAAARLRLGIRDPVSFEDEQLERVEGLASMDLAADELLAGLPPSQREAVRLRVLEDLSYAEIADRLETSELVIRKRVSRGLARLRATIEEER